MNIFNIVKTSRFFKHEKNKISGLERKPQLTIKGLSHGMGGCFVPFASFWCIYFVTVCRERSVFYFYLGGLMAGYGMVWI